jgi:hypothetical protein
VRRIFNQDFSPAKRRATINQIKKRDGVLCKLCLKPFEKDYYITIDHFIGLAWGGTDTIDNWILAHGPCNSSKEGRGFTWVWHLILDIQSRFIRPPVKIGKIRKLEQDIHTLKEFAQKETEWFGVSLNYFLKHNVEKRSEKTLAAKKDFENLIQEWSLEPKRLNHLIEIGLNLTEKSRANNQDLKSILNNPKSWPNITNPELKYKIQEYVQLNPEYSQYLTPIS